MTRFERLSALDNSFLELESAVTPMHLAATLVFERPGVCDARGCLDLDRIRKLVLSRLPGSPRMRMRLARTGLTGHPVWVDDEHFDLDYHLRPVALPAPGSPEQLRELVGRVLSQPLDRARPLWEFWVVDGLEGDRCAAICKIHHCLMDGMAGVGLMAVLLGPQATAEVPEPAPWSPHPAPRPERLLLADALRRAAGARRLAGEAARLLRAPAQGARRIGAAAGGLWETLREAATPASPTPLNRKVGPHRRVRWLRMELAEMKAVKQRLGGTVNDVVVAVVAGGLRRFFRGRGLTVEDLACRAMLPVNVRTREQAREAGNRLVVVGGPLPVHVASPVRRYARVRETTERLKRSGLPTGVQLIEDLSEWVHSGITVRAARLSLLTRCYNVMITNVPGPQIPLYALESPMLEVYPTLPLFHNQALSVAVFSYAGWLHWGLTADRHLLPDLDDVAAAFSQEFAELRKAAGE